MKNKIWARIFIAGLALVAGIFLVVSFRPRGGVTEKIPEGERLAAYLLLLDDLPDRSGDYIEYRRLSPEGERGPETKAMELVSGDGMVLTPGGALEFVVDVPTGGSYSLAIRSRRIDPGLADTVVAVTIDGISPFSEAGALALPRIWTDATKEFGHDRYGDETLPQQVPDTGWLDGTIYDGSARTVEPVYLYFSPGRSELRIENRSDHDLEIASLRLEPPREVPNYGQYAAAAEASGHAPAGQGAVVELDAISYSGKNSYDVRMGALTDPSVSPSHPIDRLMNVLESESWDRPGEEVRWDFTVPETGTYSLTLHYTNPKSDFSAFRTVRIDGEIPFAEVAPYEFAATGATGWKHETLAAADGSPYRFLLEAGPHSLSLKAEKEPVTDAVRALKTVIAHMNYFGIEIMKVAGRDVDVNRTWRLTDYLAKTPDYLEAYRVLVEDVIADLSRFSAKGGRSSMTAPLDAALFKLRKLAEDPDELPVYLKDIYSTSIYDRPVTQILGDTINLLEDARMGLDDLILEGGEPAERRDNASIFAKGAGAVQALAATYTSDKYVTRNTEGELNVWVTRPITHIDLMQKMADAGFTAQTGIPVKISVMPEPNRLILATAANTTPDMAMGLPSYIPFDLAIRGATYELSSFDDFWSFARDFSPGAFIPYVLNERVYGMPETLDFHALVYRKDIFRQLGLELPDTWDDVNEILPVLQRYGMNFYHPIAGGLPTLKWFYQTSPFVYQFGGRLYNPDGLSVALDDPATVSGLRYLSDLFSLYALQEQVPAFYNSFRFGVIPAGIVDSQTYLQLKYAAPELKGQWALSAYPGIPDENGDPQRWFIANGVAAVIMKDSDLPEEAWEFLKWWLSEEVQVDFGYRLQSTYGPEFLWISANLEALRASPIDPDDKDVILEQVKWQRDVPRTPAQYMLERGLSDIWINSATRNRPIRTEIDKMIPVIDREVTRKMIEFGFIDAEGNVVKPFVVPDIEWIRGKIGDVPEGDGNEQ